MSFYLLDHPNPNGLSYSLTRSEPIRGIVLHTAENVADTIGPDGGAEAVAKYGASTTRASWHVTVDKDSIIYMLPDRMQAWHVIGYNQTTLGIEQACQASKWNEYPADWVDAVITNTATVVKQWCELYDIPMKRITKAEYDSGKRGILAHADLDPTRRSDPGADYPWDLLFEKLEADMALTDEDIERIAKAVWAIQLGPSVGNISTATALSRAYGYAKIAAEKDPADVVDELAARLGEWYG